MKNREVYTFKKLVEMLADVKSWDDLCEWFNKMDWSFQQNKITPKEYQTFEKFFLNFQKMHFDHTF